MIYDTIILTPNIDTAEAINFAYRESFAHDPSKVIKAYSVFSFPGGVRCKKLVIMPVPDWESPEKKHLHEIAVLSHGLLPAKDGQVIRL